jgi:hypothetical protein
LFVLQPIQQERTSDIEIVNWKPWEHSMSNIESLRYCVEREGDQSLIGCSPRLRLAQRSFQKYVADAATLMTGGHEQLREKPQVATDPTEGKAKDVICILSRVRHILLRAFKGCSRLSWRRHVFASVKGLIRTARQGLRQVSFKCQVVKV